MSDDLEKELFGGSSNNNALKYLLYTLLFVFVLMWLGYFYYLNYMDLHNSYKPSAQQILDQREHIRQLLLQVRPDMDYDKAMNGFWYVYTDENGIQHFAFFSLNKLARLGLSDYQIQQFLSRIKKAKIQDKDEYTMLSEAELPDKYKFHNHIYSSPLESNYINIKYTLEQKYKSGKYNKDDLFRLAYLYDLEGRFADRDKIYKLMCKKYSERCKNVLVYVEVSGIVQDNTGKPLSGVMIKNLSGKEITHTDANGHYSLRVKVGELEKLRFLADKPGYSDGTTSLMVLTTGRKKYNLEKIILSPLNEAVITVDTSSGRIIGEASNARIVSNVLTINTDKVSYAIPLDAIRDDSGKPFKGKVEIHTMFYTRDNAPGSLMNTDVFDSALGYSGNRMYTFGMPYIKLFIAKSHKELFIYKAKPITIKYKMLHMDELYKRKIITPAQLQDMVSLSHETSGFPINRKYIKKYNLWGFPTFWVFDRARGVWQEVGQKILDTKGLAEAIFYHRSY